MRKPVNSSSAVNDQTPNRYRLTAPAQGLNSMKTAALALTAAALLAAHGSPVSAATIFNDADAANNYISTPGNWTNGLPGVGNDGTIAMNAGFDSSVTHTNYGNVTHSAGQITYSGTVGLNIGSGTNWTMSGTATASSRGLSVSSGGTFTLNLSNNASIADFSNNDRDVNTAGNLTIDTGVLRTGRSVTVNGGTFKMNGGAVTYKVAGHFGSSPLSSSGILTFNAGNVTASRFNLRSGTTVTLGSTGAGLLDFDDWGTGLYTATLDRAQDSGININFLSGSQIALDMGSGARGLDFTNDSINNPYGTAWAQALWETNRLRYAGQTSANLGGLSWADASNSSVGVGGGEYFNFTAAGTYGGSLSLAPVVPEPATLALLGLGGMLMLGRRGRRNG